MQAVKHVGWVGFERFGDEGCCSTFHYGSGCILIRNSVKKIKSVQSELTETEEAESIYTGKSNKIPSSRKVRTSSEKDLKEQRKISFIS